jgi:regulator of sigma E protease
MDIVWKILWGIIGISLLVTIHEFGHYWVARKLGFKVLRFSVGFGKPLWMRRGRDPDQIEYVVAAIPLGGYVRMLDERDGDPIRSEDRPRAFTSKPPWQRILVLLAGPAANILFAILVLWVMTWINGVVHFKPVADEIVAGKPAAEAGLRSRDMILSVNGRPVADYRQLQFKLLAAVSDDGPVVLRVRNDSGAERDVIMPLADADQRFALTGQNKLLRGLGFDFWQPPAEPRVSSVIKNGPAEKAGLKPGDLIIAADQTTIGNWRQLNRYVRERPGQQIVLKVRRGNEEIPLPATPESVRAEGTEFGRLQFYGPAIPLDKYPAGYVVRAKPGPLQSLGSGAAMAWEMTAAQAVFFWRMVMGDISKDNLTSVLTIADYAGQAASAGPSSFIMLLVLLSLSLGFLNLLPIPLLDGGQVVFQAAEWVRGRPLSERVQALGQQVGLVAIVLLMGVALFNDVNTYLFPGSGK